MDGNGHDRADPPDPDADDEVVVAAPPPADRQDQKGRQRRDHRDQSGPAVFRLQLHPVVVGMIHDLFEMDTLIAWEDELEGSRPGPGHREILPHRPAVPGQRDAIRQTRVEGPQALGQPVRGHIADVGQHQRQQHHQHEPLAASEIAGQDQPQHKYDPADQREGRTAGGAAQERRHHQRQGQQDQNAPVAEDPDRPHQPLAQPHMAPVPTDLFPSPAPDAPEVADPQADRHREESGEVVPVDERPGDEVPGVDVFPPQDRVHPRRKLCQAVEALDDPQRKNPDDDRFNPFSFAEAVEGRPVVEQKGQRQQQRVACHERVKGERARIGIAGRES